MYVIVYSPLATLLVTRNETSNVSGPVFFELRASNCSWNGDGLDVGFCLLRPIDTALIFSASGPANFTDTWIRSPGLYTGPCALAGTVHRLKTKQPNKMNFFMFFTTLS